MERLGIRLRESGRAFRRVFANRGLRRLELAWAASIVAQWAYGIGLAVYAYAHGGAAAVGLVGLLRFAPAALVAPFAGTIGDRYRRDLVMVSSDVARAALVAAAGIVAATGGAAPVVYAIAAAVGVVACAFSPAQHAILPALADTPEELTAANVVSSTIESAGIFIGPAIGGLLLAATGVSVVFFTTAGAFLWSAALVAGIGARGRTAGAWETSVDGIVRSSLAGFRAIGGDRDLRVVVVLYGLQTFVSGALNVLVVVSALKLLELGQSGVGFLNSAVGIGGVVGALVAMTLVGRAKLATDFGAGVLLWGVPLVLIGVWPTTPLALVMLGLIGVGNTIVDVAALTLLQRAVADDVLARVLGVLESVLIGTIAVGAILAPLLIDTIGIRGALLVTGGVLPLSVALLWRRLRGVDSRGAVAGRELELLRAIPLFAPLPLPTLEHLARTAQRLSVDAGATVVREGEVGDRFYVVDAGSVEVTLDRRPAGTLGHGDFFGEIALLRDVPRTATVRALEHTELVAIERSDFVAAVTGYAPSAAAAEAVVGARLAGVPAGI